MPAAAHRSLIFLSSVQKELQAERRAVKDFVHGDPVLSQFFEVFLFEDIPASGRRADQVYLAEVDRCDLYLGLFGQDYGYEDAAGISPTEHEFDRATASGKDRRIFVIGPDATRHPKMQALVRKASDQVVRRRVASIAELTTGLYASLVERLTRQGIIQSGPFEDGPCATAHATATEADLSAEAVATFVRRARAERQFPLPENTPVTTVLTHLHLLAGTTPSRAAVLLFGRDPIRWLPSAEIRCMHFHGTEVARPVPLYQIFKGTVFEQVDLATNFVLSVINRSVGTRALSNAAPVVYEIPPDVVREAIVNAVAHRDYASAAAIQVSVFADRVEIRNPGDLRPPLTPEGLRHPHTSIARNAYLCDALFLARYIEKFGTGTLMMIRESRAHALAEPDFAASSGEFVLTLWRDWLTPEALADLGLNERQLLAVRQAKTQREITNADYQKLAGVPHRTAARDLMSLVRLGVFDHHGKGPGAKYAITRNRAIIVPNVPTPPAKHPTGKRVKNVPEVPKPTAYKTQPFGRKMVKSNQPANSAPATQVETPVKTRANTPKTRVETPVKTPEQILAIFATDPVATLAEVAARLGKSPSAVERATAKLVKAGRLRHIGPTKSGHWEVLPAPAA